MNVEVQALITFGRFTAGKLYLLDLSDPHYPPLIAAGYLRVTNTFVEVADELETGTDSGSMASVPDTSVVQGKRKGRPRKKVTSGESEHQPAGNEPVFSESDDATGPQDG